MPDFRASVLEALHELGLAPDEYMVFGGAALALHGIRLARDVDLLVHPEVFDGLADNLQSPGGLYLTPKTKHDELYLSAEQNRNRNFLPLDLGTVSGHNDATHFNYHIERADILFDGISPIRFMSLRDILEAKQRSLRIKDFLDTYKIKRHIDQPERLLEA